jgi:hypothetical protein
LYETILLLLLTSVEFILSEAKDHSLVRAEQY